MPGSGYTDGSYTGVNLITNHEYLGYQAVGDITVSGGGVTVLTLTDPGQTIRPGASLVIDTIFSTPPAGLQTGSGFSVPVTSTTTGENNTAVGRFAARFLETGSNGVYLGYQAGQNATGSGNVFLGYQAGFNETGSNKLYISNTNTSTPLIKGDFDSGGGSAGSLQINGDLIIKSKTPATAGSAGVQGEIAWDSDYIYICTASNTWKRVGISTWV